MCTAAFPSKIQCAAIGNYKMNDIWIYNQTSIKYISPLL